MARLCRRRRTAGDVGACGPPDARGSIFSTPAAQERTMQICPSPPSSPRAPHPSPAAPGAAGRSRPAPGGGAPASPPSSEALPPAQRMTAQEMLPLLDRVPLAEGMSVPALWETRLSGEDVAGINVRAAAHLAVVNPLVQQMLVAPPAPRAGARDSAAGIRDTAADLVARQRRLADHVSALATPWPPPDLSLVGAPPSSWPSYASTRSGATAGRR